MSEPDDDQAAELDVSNEPEPDWADAIRRGRRERAERLRRLLGAPRDREPAATDHREETGK